MSGVNPYQNQKYEVYWIAKTETGFNAVLFYRFVYCFVKFLLTNAISFNH